MKNLITLTFILFAFILEGHSQAEVFNLEANNLHKKVRKTIEHYYRYDTESGGFVKSSVNINRFNDDGNLAETFYEYSNPYGDNSPVKKLYNYNKKGLLLSTKDISTKRGSYSTEYKNTYDTKGNLIKSESEYKDGSKFYSVYKYDNKNKLINKKEYNKDNILTSDDNYTYNGNNKTVVRTSFNSKDGSIVGTYTTFYENDKSVKYQSENSYGASTTTYTYDKEDNIKTSNYKGKTSSLSTYDYVYDKKDNWVKKHYRNGKYQYFYFREIHFKNGSVTGSTNFDKQFINSLGNFGNVNVVPLKKQEFIDIKKDDTPIIVGTNYSFSYALIGETLYSLEGSNLIMTSPNGLVVLKNSDTMFLTVTVKDKDYKYNFNLKTFTKSDDSYEWVFENVNGNKAIYKHYKKQTAFKDSKSGVTVNVNSILSVFEVGQPDMTMYLK